MCHFYSRVAVTLGTLRLYPVSLTSQRIYRAELIPYHLYPCLIHYAAPHPLIVTTYVYCQFFGQC